MKVLDLFSGIGGFSLGLERAGMETAAFCEIDPFCQKVLAKHWPGVLIYDDVREVTAEKLRADGIFPDIITGGFPCQDISCAGKKVGLSGGRSGLWSELHRVICEFRPRYAIVENVTALLNRGAAEVCRDLAASGFDSEWHCVSASMLGAPHHRDRFWLVAYPYNQGEPVIREHDEAQRMSEPPQFIPTHPKCREREVGWLLEGMRRQWESVEGGRNWAHEDSPLGLGVDDGLPDRMDRLRSLGNAVIPQIPEIIGRAIMEIENDR